MAQSSTSSGYVAPPDKLGTPGFVMRYAPRPTFCASAKALTIR
jgi:hypothetical protein